MGSNYIVVAKYNNEAKERIVLNMATDDYKQALETKERLINLGHLAEVIDISLFK